MTTLKMESAPAVTEPPVRRTVDALTGLRKEMEDFYKTMADFQNMEPIDILKKISVMTSRFSYVRCRVVQSSENRQLQNFRTKEIDPFLEECDRQFKIWSRIISTMSLDWDMTRG